LCVLLYYTMIEVVSSSGSLIGIAINNQPLPTSTHSLSLASRS
jgi:hypothetical protein